MKCLPCNTKSKTGSGSISPRTLSLVAGVAAEIEPHSSNRRERAPQDVGDGVDMLLFRDQRRCDQRRVARRLQMQAVVEQLLLEHVAAPPRRAIGREVDGREQAITADVGDRRRALQAEDGVEEVRCERAAALEQ